MPICIRPVLGNEKLFLEVFFIQVFHLKLSNNYRIYNLNNLMKYDVRINLVGAQNDLHIPFMKLKKKWNTRISYSLKSRSFLSINCNL